MKCHLHLVWRGPEYETCVLLQEISHLTRLADFSPTPVTQWRWSQIWVKKAPVLEAAWLETPESIGKSINPVLFLPRAFHYVFLLGPNLRVFTALFKPHKDNPKATREKEETDPPICERHWSFFYASRSQHRQARCCCCCSRPASVCTKESELEPDTSTGTLLFWKALRP